jgi:predicted transcriptional regulator
MWDNNHSHELSRRERQVVEIVMKHGRVSARQIEEALPDAPTYSAVRSILRLLVERGVLLKEQAEGRDWFRPPLPAKTARLKALKNLVQRLFDDSPGEAAVALLGQKDMKLSDQEAAKLIELIEQARRS